jgi:hypothetical protein
MLGQPSSLLERTHPSSFSPEKEDQDMDLDAAVGRLYANVREDDLAGLILREQLDEKSGMLMDGSFRLESSVYEINVIDNPLLFQSRICPNLMSTHQIRCFPQQQCGLYFRHPLRLNP